MAKNKKNIKENFPQSPKSSVTYPVPDKIEITLKKIVLRFNEFELLKVRYIDSIKIDKSIILKKVFFGLQLTHYFLTNLRSIDAAAGVMPGRRLASPMFFGLCLLSSSMVSFESPEHWLKSTS